MPHAACNFPAVRLKLCFTRAACADAAAELRHLNAASGESRQHVVQLSELHLQLTFSGSRMLGKNIEDQLRSIDHSPLNNLFDIALLGRAEIVIEEQDIGVDRSGGSSNFLELASADQRCGIGTIAALQDFADHLRTGTLRQSAKFRQRFIGIELGNTRLCVGSWRGRRRSLHCRGFACDRSLRRNRSARTASPRSDIDSNKECALALRLSCGGDRRGHTSACTRSFAGFLAMRTSQAEKAYPSVPEAVATVAAEAAVPATAFSGCTVWPTCVEATRPITTVEIACLKISCS